MERYLTTSEAAERLRCSKWTIVRMIKRGELEASKPNRIWLVKESTLAAFMKRKTKPAVKPAKQKPQSGGKVWKIT